MIPKCYQLKAGFNLMANEHVSDETNIRAELRGWGVMKEISFSLGWNNILFQA
jgi:hypothetical protein